MPNEYLEEYRQVQDDEKLVLSSIFGDDAKIAVGAWKVWKPLSVVIHLTPIESESQHDRKVEIFVDIEVVCSEKYPSVPPVISARASKGVKQDDMSQMLALVKAKCEDLVGSPMILEVCEVVRNFLYSIKSPSVPESFHEIMLKKIAQEQAEMRRQRANSERRELELVTEAQEKHLIEAEMKKENEFKKPMLPNRIKEAILVVGGHTITKTSSKIIDRRPRPNMHCNEWTGSFNGEDVLVSEWNFTYTLGRLKEKGHSPPIFDDFLKQCDLVESALALHCNVTTVDQTIVPCVLAKMERRAVSATNMNIVVHIVQKIRNAEECITNCLEKLKNDGILLRRFVAHAVCGVRWLHDQQFTHGHISSSVFWRNGDSFRISDFGLLAHLLSLSDMFECAINKKEFVPAILTDKNSKKRDLFALGIVIDGLRSFSSPKHSLTAEDELNSFIRLCQGAKVVEELMNHSYLNLQVGFTGSDRTQLPVSGEADRRLTSEFILMRSLGSGAFGDVILARNRLEGNDYAVKRIPLDPNSEKLNRRIMREAKLFSRLHHPHVVRYYSAWIEESRTKEKPSPTGKLKDRLLTSPRSKRPMDDSLLATRLRNIGAASPSVACGDTSEWSTSYASRNAQTESESESCDEDSIPCVESLFSHISDDNYDIVFEDDGDGKPEAAQESSQMESDDANMSMDVSVVIPSIRLLYIQMEYCALGTLRAFIDGGALIGNYQTIWRMFSEILSGLQYIHRQEMIHRDIKPMNILLDDHQHIKIGDFGLATRDLLIKKDLNVVSPLDAKASGQTRDIGTELYMAPELFQQNGDVPYSAKIDIYSTGIVLFEMFYRPLPAGMDRAKTLRDLRKSDMSSLPSDFGEGFPPRQCQLATKFIMRMLSYSAEKRPSVDEILADDQLPLTDDENLSHVLQSLGKKGSRTQQSVLRALFKEECSRAEDYCFDIDICKYNNEKYSSHRDSFLATIHLELSSIFHLHSFEQVNNHLLVPRNTAESTADTRQPLTVFVDNSGYHVALPTDLRQNFVRFCCRSAVNRMKRYTFDRVFRPREAVSIGGVHPVERWECSLDCVGPTSTAVTLTSDLLAVVCEIATSVLDEYRCTLRIGHMGLVEAAILHLNIPNKMAVLQALHEIVVTQKDVSLSGKINYVSQLCSVSTATALFQYLLTEASPHKLKENCKALLRSRDEAVQNKARRALAELEKLAEIVNSVSSRIKIVFDTSLVYRPKTFNSGLVFLLSAAISEKKKQRVVLAGGRYDDIISIERHPKDVVPANPICLIGCSIFTEVLAQIRQLSPHAGSVCSAIVCSFSDTFLREKFLLAHSLRSRGVSTDILHDPIKTLDGLMSHCEEQMIEHLVVVNKLNEAILYKNGRDCGKYSFESVVEEIGSNVEHEEIVSTILSTQSLAPTKTLTSSAAHTSASFANCNTFIVIPGGVALSTRKRLEGQARAVLQDIVTMFTSMEKIEVMITDLSSDLIKSVAGSISRSTSYDQLSVLFDSMSRQYGRSKLDIECIYERLQQLYNHNATRTPPLPVMIFFRHSDNFYKIVV